MGEIADAMLEGALCEGCGEYLGEDGFGPRLCAGCAKDRPPMHYTTPKDRRRADNYQSAIAVRKPFKCPTCHRRFRKEFAVAQHARDVHQGTSP